MGSSFECAETSLLCAEEDTSIFDDDVVVDDNCGGGVVNVILDDFQICDWEYRDLPKFRTHKDKNFVDLDWEPILQLQSEECLASMFEKETQHLPALDYLNRLRNGDLDLAARKQAIHWIEKVQSHYNFGPLSVYLAVNYLDRFLSAYELPKGNTWMMQLLAVACLSLAAKLEETDVPLSLDLQVGEAKFIFEAITIQRMELLVLSTLKWRMQAVTPFSFIDYFLNKVNEDEKSPRSLLSQSIQLILCTMRGIDFLEFKPSEIAAAVAISVREEETQTAAVNPAKALAFLPHHVQKERVVKCVELMHDLTWSSSTRCNKRGSGSGSGSTTSVPQSPNGVLDAAACLSYNTNSSSDDASISTPSSANSSPAPAPKRRKLARTLNF